MTATRLTAVLLSLWAVPAAAQRLEPAETLADARPWYQDVPLDAREAARKLFKSGNALFKNGILARAAPEYAEALKHWDHPNIHYNLGLAQMNLDQPVEAHANFIAALKYGEAPLQQVRFTLAKSFKDLLERQLSLVQIRCDELGARVEMDGQLLFTGPGAHEAFVRPGPHVIVASKEGLVTNEVARTFEHGARVALNLKLNAEEEMIQYRRRWSPAVPLSFLAAGAAVAAGGGGLFYAGVKAKRDAEGAATSQCPEGCDPPLDGMSAKRAQSARLQRAAIGAFAVGGATFIVGVVLEVLNRTEPFRRPYEVDAPAEPKLSLIPMLDNNVRGAVAAAHF